MEYIITICSHLTEQHQQYLPRKRTSEPDVNSHHGIFNTDCSHETCDRRNVVKQNYERFRSIGGEREKQQNLWEMGCDNP